MHNPKLFFFKTRTINVQWRCKWRSYLNTFPQGSLITTGVFVLIQLIGKEALQGAGHGV